MILCATKLLHARLFLKTLHAEKPASVIDPACRKTALGIAMREPSPKHEDCSLQSELCTLTRVYCSLRFAKKVSLGGSNEFTPTAVGVI